jgi:hypothetical protein
MIKRPPALRIVPTDRRRKKRWPVSPVLPKFDPDKLTPEQARRMIVIARRSGVTITVRPFRWLAQLARDFWRQAW